MKRWGLFLLMEAFLAGGGLWYWQSSERDLVLDLASRDPDVVMAASRRLWEDSREGIDIGPTLIRGMQHPSPRVRSRSVLTLARMQVTSCADEAAALLADPDQGVRIQAARALRTLRGWSTPAPLLRSLEDRDETTQIRVEVAGALGQRGEPAAEAPLARIATDPSEPLGLRQEALGALGGLGAETKAPLMTQILLDPTQPIRLRQAAIAGLAKLSGPDARSALIVIAKSPEQAIPVRAHAAASLGCQGQVAEQALLRDLVAAPDQPLLVRLAAAQSLTHLDMAPANLVDLIRQGLRDPSARVRSEAACLAEAARNPDLEGELQSALDREEHRRVRRSLGSALNRLRQDAEMDPDSALAR